jgi:peptide/nickel transport system ATP-binding protein
MSVETEDNKVTMPLVEVRDLTMDFWQQRAWVNVVNRVSFTIHPGEAFALVGESGCGKSTTVYTLLGYRHPASRVHAGEVLFKGRNLLTLSETELQRLRGGQIGLVPQDPTSHLTPSMRVGEQIAEVLLAHGVSASPTEAFERVHDLLHQVRIPHPKMAANKYPHQMSGGQQQRVAIAMALACNPQLVVLDEPTTGLDVTTQAHILDLLANLRRDLNIAFAYVTHDLSVVATLCDRVGVMYAGEIVEQASTARLFGSPRHPYTRGLIAAVPRLRTPRRERSVLLRGMLRRRDLPAGCKFAPRCDFATDVCYSMPQTLQPLDEDRLVACWRVGDLQFADGSTTPLAAGPAPDVLLSTALPAQHDGTVLKVDHLSCAYEWKWNWRTFGRHPVPTVHDVSFAIARGETFALVGESGSGKSTIAKAVAGLLSPTGGTLHFDQQVIPPRLAQRPRDMLRRIRLILQNPDASLNPRQHVIEIIGRPLEVFFDLSSDALRERAEALLRDVRLDSGYLDRFPHQLSGGERQRVAIACALAAEPDLLVCDEVLSALDVSVQAEVLELLRTLQTQRHIAYLFISHDLAVVRSLANQVGVMYQGELVEMGSVEEVYTPPYHPYTHVLLSSVPSLDTEQKPLVSPPPPAAANSPDATPACPFARKCPWKLGDICDEIAPPWQRITGTHSLRCHLPLAELQAREMALWSRAEGIKLAETTISTDDNLTQS